jgi:hypothetical protein
MAKRIMETIGDSIERAANLYWPSKRPNGDESDCLFPYTPIRHGMRQMHAFVAYIFAGLVQSSRA